MTTATLSNDTMTQTLPFDFDFTAAASKAASDARMADNRSPSEPPLVIFCAAGLLLVIGGLIAGNFGYFFWLGLVTLSAPIPVFVIMRRRRNR